LKFIGVELSSFACFERQFVPLQPGLNLLVGKNNSGKSAILNALPLLRNAFQSDQPSTQVALGPYVRGEGPQAHCDFAVFFELETGDQSIFDPAQPFDWIGFVLKRRPVLVNRFRIWRESPIFAFRGTDALVPGWPGALPVVEVGKQGVNSLHYNPPANLAAGPTTVAPHSRRGTMSSPGGVVAPDGMLGYQQAATSPWLQAFGTLRRLRFVRPQRIVTDRSALATTNALAPDGSDLANYLQTLQANRRQEFLAIEEFIVGSFPEFERVNPVSENNQATIKLTRCGSDEDIPLAYCGTGVAQLLVLAAHIAASRPNEFLLMDEPHSYLHPAAERALLQFFEKFADRYFVVATHSAVLMNGITSDRVTHLQSPGTAYDSSHSVGSSKVLHDLGYRNSDVLFFDRLIIVEGPSDSAILRRLLELSGKVPNDLLQNTGFISIDGIDESARDIQTKILHFEKLLEALGRAKMPRQYLLDGDRKPDDITLLEGTKNLTTDEPVNIKFLQRAEIENYLLVPEAIVPAIVEEASLAGVSVDCNPGKVRARLDELLTSQDVKLFPHGNPGSVEHVKASKLLEKLYEHFGDLRYDKNRSGLVIAKNLTAQNAIGLHEIVGRLDVLTSA